MWPLYGIARWPLFRSLVTVEVYVSSIRTRAFARYIEVGHCSGVAVKTEGFQCMTLYQGCYILHRKMVIFFSIAE